MKIICIGRNYSAHAKELGHALPMEPVFFMKPDSSLLIKNRPFFYPDFSSDIHYEAELVYKICKVGKSIQEKFAKNYYDEVAFGIDFTARDLQQTAIKQGLPWEKTKGFDRSAAISSFFSIKEFEDKNIEFSLLKNGELVQKAKASDMIFSIDKIIAHVSKFVTLKMGDLIYTGTPSGVGPVTIGDTLEGLLFDKKVFLCRIK